MKPDNDYRQALLLYVVIIGLIGAVCLIGKGLGIPEFQGFMGA